MKSKRDGFNGFRHSNSYHDQKRIDSVSAGINWKPVDAKVLRLAKLKLAHQQRSEL